MVHAERAALVKDLKDLDDEQWNSRRSVRSGLFMTWSRI